MERMYTTAEVAVMLKVSVRTLERWRREGIGPRWVTFGKRGVRYPESGMAEILTGGAR